MRVSVFGLGYVGVVSAGCLTQNGHEVIGVDRARTKVELINSGQSPIIETEIGEIIASAVGDGRLRATEDTVRAVNGTELSFVCVGTPSQVNGNLDLSYIRRVCEEIGTALKDKAARHTVVIRSTILPGTMRGVVIPTLEAHSGKQAGSGFDTRTQQQVWKLLEARKTPKNPFGESVEATRTVHFVRPELVARIKFTEWTHEGRSGAIKMRAPVFLGLRNDKEPRECIFERPRSAAHEARSVQESKDNKAA